jgi:hypothetical protein
MRGVQLMTMVTVGTETGHPRRFVRLRQLIAFLGLVPSERFIRVGRGSRVASLVRQQPHSRGADGGSVGDRDWCGGSARNEEFVE